LDILSDGMLGERGGEAILVFYLFIFRNWGRAGLGKGVKSSGEP
jgi:hypothetical protein